MQRIFPRALVACIAEGRSPQLTEFDDLVATILRQTFAGLTACSAKEQAGVIADVAFHGCRTR